MVTVSSPLAASSGVAGGLLMGTMILGALMISSISSSQKKRGAFAPPPDFCFSCVLDLVAVHVCDGLGVHKLAGAHTAPLVELVPETIELHRGAGQKSRRVTNRCILPRTLVPMPSNGTIRCALLQQRSAN